MSARFEISRPDGRSHQQVIIDYVADGEPDRIYTYDELAGVLRAGFDGDVDRQKVSATVRMAQKRLLETRQRALRNVRKIGYRIAFAKEHRALALVRTRRADVQIRGGLRLMEQVRRDELEPNDRLMHDGMLLIMSGMYQQQHALSKRLSAVERAIKDLTSPKKAEDEKAD